MRDRLWPTVGHFSPEEAEKEEETRQSLYDPDLFDLAEHHSSEMIDDAVDQCKQLLDLERQRGQSVQDRLNNIVGLSAIAATVTFGSLLSQVYGKQDAIPSPWYTKATTLVLTLYILAQLVCAILAALHGLARRSYMEPIPSDLLPSSEDTAFSVKRRRARSYLVCVLDHYKNNSDKVDQLAVVHEALRNFLGGVVLLAAILIGLALMPPRSSGGAAVSKPPNSSSHSIEPPHGPQGQRDATSTTTPIRPISQASAGSPPISCKQLPVTGLAGVPGQRKKNLHHHQRVRQYKPPC
jgi:hypothetical protein